MEGNRVYPTELRTELETAAALDLGDLRKEMILLTSELPGLTTKSAFQRMAICFEAGFRCGVHASIEALPELNARTAPANPLPLGSGPEPLRPQATRSA